MKKISTIVILLLALPVYSQGILGTLNQYQDGLQKESPSSPTKPEVKPSPEARPSISKTKCEENDQTSLPLAYVTSLILERNGSLDVKHDPRAGTLTVSAPEMIGNCSSMIEWKLHRPELGGKQAYAIEAKIKGSNCSENGCVYKVAKVEKGEFQSFEEMTFKPTLKGFEQCLQESGVITNGKVNKGAIYGVPVNEKFTDVKDSGKVLHLSHGPQSPLVKAKYGKFEFSDVCDFYEPVIAKGLEIKSFEDSEKERLDAEAAKLEQCKPDEYHKVADFLDKYESYSTQLGQVRDRLILDAAKKSAKAIGEGKHTEEDLRVIADFEKYIVTPKVDQARIVYTEMIDLEGEAKEAKKKELLALQKEIASFRKKPYFTEAHVKSLINKGEFEDAEKLYGILVVTKHNQKLGVKENNRIITPAVASSEVLSEKIKFKNALEVEKEKYEYRTGQTSGKADFYARMEKNMREDIQVRTQNFTAEIQSEMARIQQPGGHCFNYWVNTNNCVKDSVERIQELEALLQHYNKVDAERAEEYGAKAKEYAKLEAEGARYIAQQEGGEEEEEKKPEPQVDTRNPSRRPLETSNSQAPQPGYFDYRQYVQAQTTPMQYQNPMGPYQQQNMFAQPQYGYQQPFLGQQNFQANYGFNGGFQMGMGQQQQGYWQNPYGAYNMMGAPYFRP
jgi:hypothetical protein